MTAKPHDHEATLARDDSAPRAGLSSLPVPYYDKDGITIYCGDCLDILPYLKCQTVITDPVWPNCSVGLVGAGRACELWADACECLLNRATRLAVQLGCDTDPAFLLPIALPFFRVCSLEHLRPSYKGRLMNTGDVAYLYGKPPKSKPGQTVIPGRCVARDTAKRRKDHPCPRRLSHVRWLVKWWADDNDVILDPFMGSGTTLIAAQLLGHQATGIEIDEAFCEAAVVRLKEQGVFPFGADQ